MSVKTESGQEATLEWERVRCFEKEVALMFLSQVKEFKEAKVSSVTSKQMTNSKPLALNTVELMRTASSGTYFNNRFSIFLFNKCEILKDDNCMFQVSEWVLIMPCRLLNVYTLKDI